MRRDLVNVDVTGGAEDWKLHRGVLVGAQALLLGENIEIFFPFILFDQVIERALALARAGRMRGRSQFGDERNIPRCPCPSCRP